MIVRSNGTVTYVGKDIAYQLWKFGLLGRDFRYRRFYSYPNGHTLWTSTADEGEPGAPEFGHADVVYNVIDTRQAYLQNVVVAGLRALGFEEQAARSIHFSYDVVALSPRCAAEMGYKLTGRRDAQALRGGERAQGTGSEGRRSARSTGVGGARRSGLRATPKPPKPNALTSRMPSPSARCATSC